MNPKPSQEQLWQISKCALRFDGWKWVEDHPHLSAPQLFLEGVVQPASLVGERKLAAFFFMQRGLFKWPGPGDFPGSDEDPEYQYHMSQWLKLYESCKDMEVPEKYRSSFYDMEY